ncbi:hypothetical protein [Nocardioides yefusunii]|uniref:DedA family protein n=1 Tax=Nocardioides yefusunii TaxID=2500546 RepID=A0ABW1R1E4_9ACTN|nr:hypothetical protein [Nocardioides yefusunii]
MGVLLSLLLSAFASALIPVINIEAILVVADAKTDVPMFALALAAGVGQMAGKWLWYWGGTNVERASWVRTYMEKPKAQASLAKWQERAEGRPVFTGGLLFLSAWGGIPPYAVLSVLAGVIKVRLWVFLVTGLAGRTLRFWTVLGGVELIRSWF